MPFQEVKKIQIPSATLSSLLHHSLSSATSGLLFGHLSSLPLPGPTDSDDAANVPTSNSSSIFITSFLSYSFFDSLSQITPPNPNPNDRTSPIVGWFSSRPFSPLCPSMRERAVTHNLLQSLKPGSSIVFLLISAFTTSNNAVHTHEYKAYVKTGGALKLRPVSVDVINVGPKFRGQYGGFVPESAGGLFGMVGCRASGSEMMEVDNVNNGKSCDVENGQFKVEGLVGESAEKYTKELEELYRKMMCKLEGLVRIVEESSRNVQEQEYRNLILRRKIAVPKYMSYWSTELLEQRKF